MFTYTPRGNRYLGLLMLGVPPVLSLLLVTIGLGAAGIARHILFALALFLTAAGTALAVRLQLPEYTYEISDAEIPGQYDLIVTACLGKRRKTDCRVKVAGTLIPCEKKKRPHAQTVLCCRLFPGDKRYFFAPEEAEGEYVLILCPNEEMLHIMVALGVKKQ